MGPWLSFATSGWAGPVFIAVTVAGLILSGIAWRKKGARSGIRGVAWSLLPIAAWLTHALPLLGRIVSAIVQFAGAVVLSPRVWLGVILVGVSAVLFLVSGGIPLVGWRKRHKAVKDQPREGGQPTASLERARGKSAIKAEAEDEMADVRDILKKHGIS
ncbi:MAG TPA: cellulose synthase [Streptosporangiaceae bacterium]|nr:cellulose synthase [Streptosporangiaceae bacterium]